MAEQLVVLEQTIGVAHPRLLEVKRIFGEEGFEQAALAVAQGCHYLFCHKSDIIALNLFGVPAVSWPANPCI